MKMHFAWLSDDTCSLGREKGCRKGGAQVKQASQSKAKARGVEMEFRVASSLPSLPRCDFRFVDVRGGDGRVWFGLGVDGLRG